MIMARAMLDCFHVQNRTTVPGGSLLRTLARASDRHSLSLPFFNESKTRWLFFMIILMFLDLRQLC